VTLTPSDGAGTVRAMQTTEPKGDTMTQISDRAQKVHDEYRQQVRETMQAFSDQALAFQDSIIRGGIDREECDREIARRRGF
jgi:hypothetical protein